MKSVINNLEECGHFILAEKVKKFIVPIFSASKESPKKFLKNVKRAASYFLNFSKTLRSNKLAGTIRGPEYENVASEFKKFTPKKPRNIYGDIIIDVGQFVKKNVDSDNKSLYKSILAEAGFTPTDSHYGAYVKQIRKGVFLYLLEYSAKKIVIGFVVIPVKLEVFGKLLLKVLNLIRTGKINKDRAEILVSRKISSMLGRGA